MSNWKKAPLNLNELKNEIARTQEETQRQVNKSRDCDTQVCWITAHVMLESARLIVERAIMVVSPWK